MNDIPKSGPPAPRAFAARATPRASSLLPLAAVLIPLAAALLTSLRLGFAGDDYVHLVQDAGLPLFESADGLFRPLRNALFKLAPRAFGLDPLPHHAILLGLHLAAVTLLYLFVRKVGGGRLAACAACVLFGFYPRNHQSLFWLAAGQDAVVAVFSLGALILFLRFREHHGRLDYLAALACFTLALGFKETAVALLPTFVLLDFYRPTGAKPWRAYVPLTVVVAVYLLVVPKSTGYYGARLPDGMRAAARLGVNLLLPFSPALEIREVWPPLAALGLTVPAVLLCLRAGRRRALLVFTAWAGVQLLPAALFAGYADRHLMMSAMGLAVLAGLVLETLAESSGRKVAAACLLCLYAGLSTAQLEHYKGAWRQASREIRQVVGRARELRPEASALYFAGLTHSTERGQVYVFNNGLEGALVAAGYPRGIRAEVSFDSRLAARLLACTAGGEAGPAVFAYADGVLHDRSGGCARAVISEQR